MKPNPKTHYRIDPGKKSRLQFWIPQREQKHIERDVIWITYQGKAILQLENHSRNACDPEYGECQAKNPIWLEYVPESLSSDPYWKNRWLGEMRKIFTSANREVLGKMIARAVSQEARILKILKDLRKDPT